MEEKVIFDVANMPVSAAAKALRMDCQSVRIMLQQGVVSWGTAFKRPKSRQYSYLISPKKFYEATGYLYEGRAME